MTVKTVSKLVAWILLFAITSLVVFFISSFFSRNVNQVYGSSLIEPDFMSNNRWINSNQILDKTGSVHIAANRWCQDGTCYRKNQRLTVPI